MSEDEKKKYKKKKQPEDNGKMDGMGSGIVEKGPGASLVENQVALKKNKKKKSRNFEIEEGLCDIVEEEQMSEHVEKYKKKKQPEDNGKMDVMSSGIVEDGSSGSLVENQVALKKHKKTKTKSLMNEEGRGISSGKFATDVEKDVEKAEIEQHGSQDGKKKRRKARDGDGGGSEAPKGEENRERKQGDDGLVNLTVDANMKKRRKDRDGDGGGSEAPKAEENRKRKQRDGDLVNMAVDTNMKKRKKDNVLKVSALSTGPTAGEASGDKNREGGKVAADDNNIVCDSGRNNMENVKARRKKNDKKLENHKHLVLEIRDVERAMVAENEASTNPDRLHISVDKAKRKVKRAHDACEFKVDSHETCTNGNQSLGIEVRKATQEISEMPSATTILNKKRKKSKKDQNSENQEAENHSENTLKNKDKLRKPIQAAEAEGNKDTSSVRKEKATDDSEVCSSKNKKCFKDGSDVSSLKKKKVSFSSEVEVFPNGTGSYNEENAEIPLIQGKRFSKEEDQKILEAIDEYIKAHQLGSEGVHKILHCQEYPEVRSCWSVIKACLPNRHHRAIYSRAHVLLERGNKSKWEPEECETLLRLYSIHGPKWKKIAREFGRHRIHVKDTWRAIRSPYYRKGTWSQEEYQTLFDLVNMDLRLKVFEEKSAKNYMLRDNISWDVISQKLVTRFPAVCCMKWYQQLASPLVNNKIWNDKDDYLLVDALRNLDACCYEDVDWDNLLEHRPGAVCRRRWTEMVRYIGMNKVRPFMEQVEVLSKRYCPEMIEYRQ
ncbi:uncharacterized protein LOC141838628 [Curcuma longa]|uniref:uncharacterized protein LOC141838628 n=1 Tax=Curcuma longa TaxID=136217 RepID=UPI003D9E8908